MPNNDLISRADVLDLVQSYGHATYDMPYGSGDMIIRPEDVMALPAVSGWISVKDRLPRSMTNKVLVWLEHEELTGYIGFGHYEKYKGQEIWFDLENNEAFSARGYKVTHWMPLPSVEGLNDAT